MPAIVTAAELAAELGTDPKRLGRWLRAERKRGHALMAGRAAGARWEFTREQATLLAEEFRVSAARGQVSDSAVQRKAEAIIRDRLAEHLGMPLEPREIKLAAGASVHVDAVSAHGTVLAEIFARQGELKGGQQKKVAVDTLKLITVRRERSEARLYIAFADQEASLYATGGGWVARRFAPGRSKSWSSTSRRSCATRFPPPRKASGWSTPTRRATSPSTTELWRGRACL